MTINAAVPFSSFAGDGVTTVFTLSWPSVEGDDFIVERVQGATRVALNHGVDWNPSSTTLFEVRSIVTTVPVALGWSLEVQRRTDLSQLTDYVSNDGHPAVATERALDKLTLALQEQDRRLGLVEGSGAGAGYTFTNLPGAGVGVFAQLVGNDAQFKRLEPGAGVTLSDNGARILIDSSGVALPVSILDGGTGQTTPQLAINALTQVAAATNEHVLTKDTATGDAVWKAVSGLSPPGGTAQFLRSDGNWSDALTGNLRVESSVGAGGGLELYQAAGAADQKLWTLEASGASLLLRARKDDGTSPATALDVVRGAGPAVATVQFPNGRVFVGSTDDGSTSLQASGGVKVHTGDLSVVGSAAAIIGDWSNATLANRTRLRTSAANGSTLMPVAPSGSAQYAALEMYNRSNLAGAAGMVSFSIDNSFARIETAAVNGGTELRLRFRSAGDDRLEIGPVGVTALRFFGYSGWVVNGNSGTSKTIDWGAGNLQRVTMTGNCTFTFTAPPSPGTCHLEMTQDGTGSRTMTLPAAVKWTAATAAGDKLLSTGAGKRDLLVLVYNGTEYLAQLFKDY